MKDLKVYISESLMDMDPDTPKFSVATIKREVNDWVRIYMQKNGGRIKVSPKPNEDGQFIVSYEEHMKYMTIDFSNVPDYILFDIDLGDGSGSLTIKNANNMSVLSKFKKIRANMLIFEKSKCTLDSPQEKSFIDTLFLQHKDQVSVELGDLSNIAIESVMTECDYCVDFSPLKKVKEFKNLHINANNGDTIKLGDLKGELLDIRRGGRGACNIKISGNYEFNEIRTYCCVVDGLPPKLNKLNDTWGYNVANAKHIQDCVSLPDISAAAAIEILEKLQSGALKIDKITDYVSPYPEIPRDEFIHDLQQLAVYTYTEGDYRNGIKAWGSHPIELDDFKKWVDSTSKYEVIPFYDPDDKRSKNNTVYMILQNGIPVGSYVERGFDWRAKSLHLYTDQKDLLMEIL